MLFLLPAWSATPNLTPTLNVISDITILEDSGSQGVSISGISDGGDAVAQTLTITATSSNPTIMLNPTVVYTSPAATGTILLSPNTDQFGTTMITVTVQDNGGTVGGSIDLITRTFTVTISPVNDQPIITAIADISISENASAQTVNFNGVASGPSNEIAQTITVTATSSDPSLIPKPTVTYTSPAANGSLSLTPVANRSGTANIVVTVSDNGGTSNSGFDVTVISFTVTVNPVPHIPVVVTNAGLTMAVGTSAVISRSLLEVSDYGPAAQLVYRLVSAPTKGNLQKNAVVLAVNNTFTQADINSGLLVYRHTGSMNESDSFNFTVTNSEMNSLASTVFAMTMNGAAVVTIPVVSLPSGSITWIQGGGPIVVNNGATVMDTSGTLVGGTLTVSLVTNAESNDRLSFRNVGTGSGQIGVSGSIVTYSNSTIGNINVDTGSVLSVVLAGTAAPTSVEALLRNLQFNNIGSAPSTATRTVQVALSNGTGGVSAPVTSDVMVQAVNQPPVISFPKISVAYLEASGANVLDNTAMVTDADSPSMSGGVVTLAWTVNATVDDNLSIRNEGSGANQIAVSGLNISYNSQMIGTMNGGGSAGSSLLITLTAAATPPAVQAMMRNLTFDNPSLTPSLLLRQLSATVSDGAGGTSAIAGLTVVVQSSNNPPVVALPSPPLTWLQGSGEQIIDGSATITDIDSAAFDTGVLVAEFMSGGNADDRLTILTDSNAAGHIDVQGTNARFGGTTIGTITGPGTISSSLVVRLNSNATVAATQELMRRLAFENVAIPPINGPRTVRVYVTDGSGGTSLPVTKTITLQSVNIVPAVTLPTGTAAWTEHAAASLIDSAATVIDSDAGTLNTGILTVSMSDAVVGDQLSIRSSGVGSGQVSLSGSTVLVSGIAVGTFMGGTDTTALSVTFNVQSTPASAQAILRLVEFSHTGQFTSVETRSVHVTITDGIDISPTATTTLTLTPIDDPPTTSAITLVTVVDTPLQTTLSGTDPEAGALTWDIVSLPSFGVLTLTNANTGAVDYVPSVGQTSDTSFTFRVSDGLTWSAPTTATIRLTTPLANVRPLIVSSPPREGVIGATYTYIITTDVSALPPGADLRYLVINPPTGATVNITRTSATTAALTWDQTGSADLHRQVGVLISDATTGTASYQPIQVLWLAVAPAGPG